MLDDLKPLPKSEDLDISALCRLFANTTNSYKYLFFSSLLDILTRRNFDVSLPISLKDLTIEMLANAWYPHTYFKLSFGLQDKLAQQLDFLKLDISEPILKFTDTDKQCLRQTIGDRQLDDAMAKLMRFVPFRLIRPFFENELRGLKDYQVDPQIALLTKKFFDTRKPLFCFNEDCQAIFVQPEWALYIQTNYSIVRGWVSWEWLKYMQQCNPNVPAVASKLFPPQKREPLKTQTSYWKLVLKHTEVRCIYSGESLSPDKIALDHYLPWSFVAHDRLWNLVPTLRAVNSAKSNNIPSDIYFKRFVAIQHLGLTISFEKITEQQWNNFVDS